jgi:arginine decarboxylase
MQYIDVGGGLGVDYDGSKTTGIASVNYTIQNYANDVVAAIRDACAIAKTRGFNNIIVPTIISESGRAVVSHQSILITNVVGVTQPPKIDKVTDPTIKRRPTAKISNTTISSKTIINQVSSSLANEANDDDDEEEEVPLVIRNLYETYELISDEHYQEAFHDASQFKYEASSLFNLGYLSLQHRCLAEQMYWGCCHKILQIARQHQDRARIFDNITMFSSSWQRQQQLRNHHSTGSNRVMLSTEMEQLEQTMSSIYYLNLSVFQSAPDTWAINQLFPIIPIHRLNEKPTERATFVDLTCDSDGKFDKFIHSHGTKSLLEVHPLKLKDPVNRNGTTLDTNSTSICMDNYEPYYIGMFLGGAYQEVMGNIHNLFGQTNTVHVTASFDNEKGYEIDHVVRGDTVSDVLNYVHYDVQNLLERIKQKADIALQANTISVEESTKLLQSYERSLSGYTYLKL